MSPTFIHNRATLADASALIDRYGDRAFGEAAALAEQYRNDGNVRRFCHWRQIQRVIATLSSSEVLGTIN